LYCIVFFKQIFSKILASDISWASLPVDELQIETAVIELLQLLLQRDPISRPAVSDMKSHSFFASIDWMTHSSSPGVFIPTLDSATDTSYFDARAEHYPVMDQSDDNPVTPTNVQWSARGTSTLMQLLGTTPVGGGTLSALPFTPLNQTGFFFCECKKNIFLIYFK
jgi:serine/threonine protein kinase